MLKRLAPGLAVWLLSAVLLVRLDAGWDPTLRYSLFLGLGIMLPGTLLWRALRGNTDGFVVDITFGSALGCVLSIAGYLPARAVGVPLLAAAVPVATVAAFAHPRLRRHWRSHGPAMPIWSAWTTAGACAVGLAVVARSGLVYEPARFPAAAFQYVDLPFHLALAGELKHHFPARIPYVSGEPLHYHWFTYAHLADASWLTGVELDLLLRRFLPVMATVLAIAAVAGLATRLARRPELRWAGPLAAWLLVLTNSLDGFGWNGVGAIAPIGFASNNQVFSPTQAFGLFLAVPTAALLVDLLRDPGRRWGSWLLLTVMLAGLAGAKASFLPVYAAGVGFVLLIRLITERRLERGPVLVLGTLVVVTGLAQIVLFGGSTAGTTIDLLESFRAKAAELHFTAPPSALAVGSTALTLVVSWLVFGSGMLGFARDRVWRDPAALFAIGCLIAGVAAVGLLFQHGQSQFYFLRAAVPVAVAGSAWGLAVLLAGVPARRLLAGLLAAGAAGLGLALVVDALTGQPPAGSDTAVGWQTSWPWLLVFAVAAVLALAGRRAVPAGLAICLVLGSTAVLAPSWLLRVSEPRCEAMPTAPGCAKQVRRVPWEGERAARYLRTHSAPDELLATNAHCVPRYRAKECETRAFWLSGYAERRVLVHGWAYTSTSNERARSNYQASHGPFWDAELLRANDIVFKAPTAAAIARLKDEHGVRWLVLDRNVDEPPSTLARLTDKRFDAGAIVIYRIR